MSCTTWRHFKRNLLFIVQCAVSEVSAGGTCMKKIPMYSMDYGEAASLWGYVIGYPTFILLSLLKAEVQ